ncbi:MAG: hypothetical protein KDB26_00245 [Microthrixaceae bacterium]|nr:hypothetical protein [Microthrixaceae bacterium]
MNLRWSMFSGRRLSRCCWHRIGPIRWGVTAVASRTGSAVEATVLHHDIGTVHLDQGYDYPKTRSGHAALCLATAVLSIRRLIDYRNRWNPPK